MSTNKFITISANCKNNPQCTYVQDEQLYIEIVVENSSEENISIPLDYIQKTGPTILLRDNQIRREIPLPTNLADEKLLDKLTMISPKQTISFGWVIFKGELEQYRHHSNIDVSAIITVYTNIFINKQPAPILVNEKTTLHIKSN